MESLVELCDLIAQNPQQFREKIAWICNRCPPAESMMTGSPMVSRSQLHAILAVARFLSKCPNSDHETPKSLILAFYRSIPSSFNPKFWPQAFSPEAISSFFNDFLNYISKAAELSPDLATDLAGFTGEIMIQTITNADSSFDNDIVLFLQIVHKKTTSVLYLTSMKNENKMEFIKILEAIKAISMISVTRQGRSGVVVLWCRSPRPGSLHDLIVHFIYIMLTPFFFAMLVARNLTLLPSSHAQPHSCLLCRSKHPSKDLHWILLCLGIYNRLDEWCIFQHTLALFCNKIHHCTTLHDVVLDQQVSKKEYVYV